MDIQKIKLEQLFPTEYNPRKALKQGDKEYEKLKKSIETYGYTVPIIWNKTTGSVVGGHQRLTVLKDLGYTEADCVVVELDETNEKALNIALNKIQGEWDDDKLSELISELSGTDIDVELTGFDAVDIETMIQFVKRAAKYLRLVLIVKKSQNIVVVNVKAGVFMPTAYA